jgi:hypothetical protein
MPPTKSLMSGTCARTLLPSRRSACLPSAASSVAVCTPKNFHDAVHAALRPRDLRHVRGRLHARHRDARLHKPLQQVAVVAGDLNDVAVRADALLRHHLLRVALRVRDPGVRVGGEIGVVREDIARRHVFLELDEQARICTCRRAAEKTAPCGFLSPRAQSSRRAATSPGRQTSFSAAPCKTGIQRATYGSPCPSRWARHAPAKV